ncbi:MAG: ATP-binding protein [Desulfovibrionaceae bacterium]|nr:ATP-binding protein [Desulfovibrionaceae bacterium]
MRIAIASGKGGAGKTTLAAALHRVWPRPHAVADMDVEAPNLHLFLHPIVERRAEVSLTVPKAVREACTACGRCRQICRYGAIALFGKKIALFPDMCHGCGGCFTVCPENALEEGKRLLGTLELGRLPDGTPYFSGTTRIGEVMTPPVLRSLLAELDAGTAGLDLLLDSPPGVSCPAVTVARRVDAMLLVVDPTPFGLADFRIAWKAFSSLGLPLACVINRAGMPGNEGGDEAVQVFCQEHGLPIAGIIPFSREAACRTARGVPLADVSPEMRERFDQIAGSILRLFEGARHE